MSSSIRAVAMGSSAEQGSSMRSTSGRTWADALDNFNYVPHAQSDDPDSVLAAIVTDYPDLHRFDVYAAGTAAQLDRAREHFVRQGLPEARWFAGATDA